MNFDNTYVTVDLDAIAANFQAVREKAGVPVMAIIKADAYGHGAVPVARLLADSCAFFGVSSVPEAMELRNAGLKNPVLILGHTPAESFPLVIRENIRPAIFHYEDALALSQAATEGNMTAPFHFALDTGMGRIGFQVTEEAADLCARIAQLPNLQPEGLFSHFACADSDDLRHAQQQLQLFEAFSQMLQDRNVHIPIRHMNNSAGIMNFDNHFDMVRSGIVTYGLYPSQEVDPALLPLKPALSWHSHVTHVKTLEPGRSVSYGATYVTQAETTVATVPVGYADGYRRNLSNCFHVLIRGQKAPILGRVCMDQILVDVTHIPGVRLDDPVVLIGKDGQEQITVEEIAQQADSFNYEFVCGIGRRVPRLYLRGGKVTEELHYLD